MLLLRAAQTQEIHFRQVGNSRFWQHSQSGIAGNSRFNRLQVEVSPQSRFAGLRK